MYLHGTFINRSNQNVGVYIRTADNDGDLEIGSEESGIWFPGEEAVEIESSVNDTMDVLLRSQATVRLLVSNVVSELFCRSCRDAVINIYRGETCVFAGYVEPQIYEQGYNEELDELELTCVDVLSGLQYRKYKGLGDGSVSYSSVRQNAAQRSMIDLLGEIIGGAAEDIDILHGAGARIIYDGSKSLNEGFNDKYRILEQVGVQELIFLGDDEDDVWQEDEVVEELLRYLNLHIVQDGTDFYVFSWESVKKAQNIAWGVVYGENSVPPGSGQGSKPIITIRTGIVRGKDTTISIGEVYNQIALTCDMKRVETLIESPLDDDLLVSPYTNKQKYMTEYGSDGEGNTAFNAFGNLIGDIKTSYSGAHKRSWFLQVMNNTRWKFGANGQDWVQQFCGNNENQQNLANHLSKYAGCAVLALGKVDEITDTSDNSPVSKVDMTNYLVVSVNGNCDDGEYTHRPQPGDIESNIPYAEYHGRITGGVFSPADEDTTNYIVISGSIALNPVMGATDTYAALKKAVDDGEYGRVTGQGGQRRWWHETVPTNRHRDGRYYTRKYWKAAKPNEPAEWDSDTANGGITPPGLMPFSGEGKEEYEFKYSAIGESADHVSKVGVLACMLVIGNKCVVETGTQGQPSDFEWRPYKSLEQCNGDKEEYYQQSFTIGFDPKIGDMLIGKEYKLQNNIDYTMGIDAEGIAIPIRKSDSVSGEVSFKILGPVNSLRWTDITRRHPSFWRHTRWTETAVALLAHVSSIFVKQLQVKVYSDNAMLNNGEDKDLMYISDTDEEFVNKKGDIEFKLCSALTSAECQQLGISNSVKLNTPVVISSSDGLRDIYDRNIGERAKPEQFYVDAYYREYHRPRIIMNQKVEDGPEVVGLWQHYEHPAMEGKRFFVQGVSRNLDDGEVTLTLKEIDGEQ